MISKLLVRAVLAAGLFCAVPNSEAYAQVRYGAGYNYGFTGGYANSGYNYSSAAAIRFNNTGYYNSNYVWPYGYNNFYNGGNLSVSAYSSSRYGGTWAGTLNLGYYAYGSRNYYSPYSYLNPYGYSPYYYIGNPYAVYNSTDVSTPVKTSPSRAKDSTYDNWRKVQEPASSPKAEVKAPKVFTEKDIFTGEAINALLDQLLDEATKGHRPAKAVDVDMSQINFHAAKANGQYGFLMLPNSDKLPWGEAFDNADAETQEMKNKIQAGYKALVSLNRQEKPTASEAKELRKDIQKLSDLLAPQIQEIGVMKYTQAKQFLRNLDSTVQFLQETPDFCSWKHGIKAKDSAALLKYLEENHVRVAPALPGTEKDYLSLHAVLKKLLDQVMSSVTSE